MSSEYTQLKFAEDSWMEHSLCRGTDSNLFFPDKGLGSASVYKYARKICDKCPVERQCLEYAVKNCINDGMWGGRSPNERRGFGTIDLGNVDEFELLCETEAIVGRHKQFGGIDYMTVAAQELGVTPVTVRRRLMRLIEFRVMEDRNGQ